VRDGFAIELIDDVEFWLGQDWASRGEHEELVGFRSVELLILTSCKKPQDSAKTQRPWE
jgi:hypothetical protein